jgi:hypothetical protein
LDRHHSRSPGFAGNKINLAWNFHIFQFPWTLKFWEWTVIERTRLRDRGERADQSNQIATVSLRAMTMSSARSTVGLIVNGIRAHKNTILSGIGTIVAPMARDVWAIVDMTVEPPIDQRDSDLQGRSPATHIHDCTRHLLFWIKSYILTVFLWPSNQTIYPRIDWGKEDMPPYLS